MELSNIQVNIPEYPGEKYDKVIALAGNPNVGKSTVFNGLTGLRQHTGNWPGKTVSSAFGTFKGKDNKYLLVDTPGTYSLNANSADEEVARDYICFGNADAIIVVCDATCLERTLNIAIQVIETGKPVVVCLNLMDEAKRKGIKINVKLLEKALKVPVIPTSAKNKKTLSKLINAVDLAIKQNISSDFIINYPKEIENSVKEIQENLPEELSLNKRWFALQILKEENDFATGIGLDSYSDEIISAIQFEAANICKKVISYEKDLKKILDRKLDKILCSRLFGYPVMIALLLLIFYLTISGANIPSRALSSFFSKIEEFLHNFFMYLSAPKWFCGVIVHGMFRTLSSVVSVMLPPMAIFFPLFTLLEDLGYLPRVAYNLDNCFKKCNACGKQALTMCMGFGCNAVGVTGCRIISSERERILAILTNSFMPCNGRFPTLTALITIFFVGAGTFYSNIFSAGILTLLILLSVFATFIVTFILSKTIFKGTPSSFTLELPPYRKPQIASIIVRSVLDRTLFVLGRAAKVAAPAGIVIWALANIQINEISTLNYIADFFDPFGKIIGLDGVIIIAFILGLPANEIVVPIMVMAYLAQGTLSDSISILQMKEILISNGWSTLTALNVMIFMLFHWPCSTTLLTIKKETGSLKLTILAAILPTAIGVLLCILTTFFSTLIL